jgi:hypothetical protein
MSTLTVDQFEESLCRSTDNTKERDWLRARVFAGIGDNLRSRGELAEAKQFYLKSLEKSPWMVRVYIKLSLASLGKAGGYVFDLLGSFRRAASRLVKMV